MVRRRKKHRACQGHQNRTNWGASGCKLTAAEASEWAILKSPSTQRHIFRSRSSQIVSSSAELIWVVPTRLKLQIRSNITGEVRSSQRLLSNVPKLVLAKLRFSEQSRKSMEVKASRSLSCSPIALSLYFLLIATGTKWTNPHSNPHILSFWVPRFEGLLFYFLELFYYSAASFLEVTCTFQNYILLSWHCCIGIWSFYTCCLHAGLSDALGAYCFELEKLIYCFLSSVYSNHISMFMFSFFSPEQPILFSRFLE